MTTDRPTASTITDDQLDALYAELAETDEIACEAKDTVSRVMEVLDSWSRRLCASQAREILAHVQAALDGPAAPAEAGLTLATPGPTVLAPADEAALRRAYNLRPL